MINVTSRILGIIVLVLGFLAISNGLKAQNIIRKGNTFIEQVDSTSRGGNATKTDMIYTDKKGVSDTIYLSKNGSAFIWKVSKKTGRVYRKYLPEVTKQLGTKKEKKDE
jgi:hypothetical protein